jgi:hypothetical protein
MFISFYLNLFFMVASIIIYQGIFFRSIPYLNIFILLFIVNVKLILMRFRGSNMLG